jgi:hypothetical protein
MPLAPAFVVAHHRPLVLVALLLGVSCAVPSVASLAAWTPVFFDDDPLAREPETQDASKAQEWTIDLFIDLSINLFGKPGAAETGVRAKNANTVDEVPDSNWFTNRILTRPVPIEEAVRAAGTGSGPAPGPWTVVAAKEIGFAPGFTIEDSSGETWFVSFDARGYPEAATAAIVVANKIFWTLGYWHTDDVLTSVRPEHVLLGDTATVRPPSGKKRAMRPSDLEAIWQRAHRSTDGSYRAVASRRLAGRPLGGFRYHGTRPDDPNDVIPHEHRRELRALKVFGAWTNLVDMKAGNTLDMLVTEGGRSVVRHYLQDVGSTFGTGANAPREYFEGWEYLYEGDLVLKRLVSLGFFIRPWQTLPYDESPAIGRFEGDSFDPTTWRARVPTAAVRHAQPDDLFWGARRVMAFSDEMIRALAHTAGYINPRDERYLADTLIKRRDKIGAAYLGAVTPLVDFALSPDGRLSFDNAAVAAGFLAAPPGGYTLSWAYFDNHTSAVVPIGETRSETGQPSAAPGPLREQAGSLVRVRVTPGDQPPKTWKPVDAYFRHVPGGWTLVGLDRGAMIREQ